MKKYTFKLDNTKKINNESTNNYSKIIDDIISANVIKNNPYFDSIPSTTKSKTINIDIHLGKKSPKYDKKSFDYGDIFDALKTIYNLDNHVLQLGLFLELLPIDIHKYHIYIIFLYYYLYNHLK